MKSGNTNTSTNMRMGRKTTPLSSIGEQELKGPATIDISLTAVGGSMDMRRHPATQLPSMHMNSNENTALNSASKSRHPKFVTAQQTDLAQ